MGEVIWVELLSRHRDVVARFRCSAGEIRVGRGYDNDVVLDDPYVAPMHLRIRRDQDGNLVAEDLGSTNGLFADHSNRRQARIVLDGERPIRIGHTLLRIRDASHAVAPERIADLQWRTWPVAAALIVAIAGLEILSVWLNEVVTEPKLSRYFEPLFEVFGVLLIWTVGWAVMSNVFTGRVRFERILLIALGGMLGYSLYNEAIRFLSFGFSLGTLVAYQYVGMWCVLAFVFFLQLRQLAPTRLRLKGAIAAAIAVLGIATQMLRQSETAFGYTEQSNVRGLLPPALRLVPAKSEDAFLGEVAELKVKLDHARSEGPPSTGPESNSDDDDE